MLSLKEGAIAVRRNILHGKKQMLQLFCSYLPPFLLLLLLLYVIANLVFGVSCPVLTSIAATLPYPERLRSPSGISAVLSALGVVVFALSYVNSAKASRVKGILLEDVISQCYPYYGLVFLSHSGFALLGLYSCEIDVLQSAWICLLGILLCTLYSLRMAYCTVFSPKNQNRLIARYVKALLSKNILSSQARRTAYQLGQYIGERYQSDDIQIGRHMDDYQEDERMLLSSLRLLMPNANDQSKTDSEILEDAKDVLEEEWEGGLPEVFDKLFSDEVKAHPEYVLFTLEARQGHDFQDAVRHCSILWDNLLLPVKREERRAELVVDVLWHSPWTTALCCGLVHRLHSNQIQFDDGKKGWQTCTRFLSHISNIARASGNEQQRPQREKVLRCCTDMMIMFFCLACLYGANSQGLILSTVFQDLQDLIDNEYQRNSGTACYIPTNSLCFTKYLYFSYTLFLLLAMPGVCPPSRSELYRQVPAIIKTMEQCFKRRAHYI